MPKVRHVSADASDEDIMRAINDAGETGMKARWSKREHDRPSSDDPNQRFWIIPNDIGTSDRDDRLLIKRLKAMVDEGLLEMRTHSCRVVRIRLTFEKVIVYDGPPRFRVARRT